MGIEVQFKMAKGGISLEVQWLRLCFKCREYELHPWSENCDPTCHMAQPEKEEEKKRWWWDFGVVKGGQTSPYLAPLCLASSVRSEVLSVTKIERTFFYPYSLPRCGMGWEWRRWGAGLPLPLVKLKKTG